VIKGPTISSPNITLEQAFDMEFQRARDYRQALLQIQSISDGFKPKETDDGLGDMLATINKLATEVLKK
jgi:hypothetical protein